MNKFLPEWKDILFLDIETASLEADFGQLPERLQEEWTKKEKHILGPESEHQAGDFFFQKAGIYAEFGKVICIGVGYFHIDPNSDKVEFRTKSFCEASEHETLAGFAALLSKKKWTLCAHNGKEFDFPYLCRRLLVNKIPLPEPLQIAGKKPWEIRHLDTMELWRFGDYKHYTRLELLAAIFNIPTSKEGIDGSQVNETYYLKGDVESIRQYCLRDVWVTAQIYLAMQAYQNESELVWVDTDKQEE